MQQPVPGLFVHRATVLDGEAAVGAPALGEVDVPSAGWRSPGPHTATHMIHKAFRELLGETATPDGFGELAGPAALRLPEPAPVPASVMADVEDRVNTLLLDDLEVTARYMSQDEARAIGAMALFGEKYGDRSGWSRSATGRASCAAARTPVGPASSGVVKFLSEASIGSGVRRIEALVGADAYRYLAREHLLLNSISQMVKARPDELTDRIGGLLERVKDAERTITELRRSAVMANIDGTIGKRHDIGSFRVWTYALPDGSTATDLREATNAALQMVVPGLPCRPRRLSGGRQQGLDAGLGQPAGTRTPDSAPGRSWPR